MPAASPIDGNILPGDPGAHVAAQIGAHPGDLGPLAGDTERDIGAVALFLASPAADYITGQNIPVNGGHLMR